MNDIPFLPGLKDKVVLVSGSSRGLGLHIAELLKELGAQVITTSRVSNRYSSDWTPLENTPHIFADISHPLEAAGLVDQVISLYGTIHHVICNAGSGQSVPPGCESYDEWQRVFHTNLWTTTNLIEASAPFVKANRGAYVCISSICGNEVIRGAPITYSVAKAAVNAYIKGISKVFGSHGVRINAIAPGNLMFEGSVWDTRAKQDPHFIESFLQTSNALQMFGEPNDISVLAGYLLSDYARFITGAVYTVDGGQINS